MDVILIALALFLLFAAVEYVLVTRRGKLKWLAILPVLPVLCFGVIWWKGSLQPGWAGFGDGLCFLFLDLPSAAGLCAGLLIALIRRMVQNHKRRETDGI